MVVGLVDIASIPLQRRFMSIRCLPARHLLPVTMAVCGTRGRSTPAATLINLATSIPLTLLGLPLVIAVAPVF